MDIYESDGVLAQYLLFHYGRDLENMPWSSGPAEGLFYPARTVHDFLADLPVREGATALDVGCAVGRSSFELTTYCVKVIGIDYSQAFITAAQTLQTSGELDYQIHEEGDEHVPATARVPIGLRRERVHFEQGDAMNLRQDLSGFDVVHASNLIDRLHTPTTFLARLPGLVRSGGYLILSSPFTWLEEFTPREHWLSTIRNTDTETALNQILAPDFECLERKDLPFLIREHRRKYQWSMACASLWQRK